MNAFEVLGLGPGLVISQETLREAFREAGRTAHPDAGGDEACFAALRSAYDILASPSRRLGHWLELRGTPAQSRGEIAPEIMDLFMQVGEATRRAESLARRRELAKSSLGRAMLESETQICREEIENCIALIENAIERESSVFPQFENSAAPDLDAASAVARNLAFLEKWRATLRASFARLV